MGTLCKGRRNTLSTYPSEALHFCEYINNKTPEGVLKTQCFDHASESVQSLWLVLGRSRLKHTELLCVTVLTAARPASQAPCLITRTASSRTSPAWGMNPEPTQSHAVPLRSPQHRPQGTGAVRNAESQAPDPAPPICPAETPGVPSTLTQGTRL